MISVVLRPRIAGQFRAFSGRTLTRWLSIAVLLALIAPMAEAHVFATSEGILFFHRDARTMNMRIRLNLEALLAGIDPEVKDTKDSPNAAEYDRLRGLPPDQLKQRFAAFQDEFLSGLRFELDGQPLIMTVEREIFNEVGDITKARNSDIVLAGQLPPDAKTFRFGWAPRFGKITISTISVNARSMHIEVLEKGDWSAPLVIDDLKARSTLDMVRDFVKIGFEHIVPGGLDHILFVIGIFLLSTRLKPILTQVTSFTVAHTVTLGLGTAGVVNLPSAVVEPLIAASIVYVAVENILRLTLSPWRPVVVFLFGLLHGLGFAGVLKDFLIPEGEFLTGLLSFNIGVELGQLTVIASCFLLVGIWFGRKPWYRQRVVIPGSLAIALVGAFWFVQRVAFA